MSHTTAKKWLPIDIPLARNTRARQRYVKFARQLQRTAGGLDPLRKILELRAEVLGEVDKLPASHQSVFRACALLIVDLVLQQWKIRISRANDVFARSQPSELRRESARLIIRAQELIKRDAQLSRPSVRHFVESMEKKRLFNGRFVSIFDLMRDGEQLAEILRHSRSGSNGSALHNAIKPYIEFVDSNTRCEFTGLRLMDIWRYFRHTWTNQYTSVPGRSMLLLIRDGAAQNHPVMGIAAVCSPIIQIRERDRWIGWHPDSFLDYVRKNPSAKLAHWLVDTVDVAIDEIYKADFIKENLITRWRLKHPTDKDVQRLRSHAVEQRKRHLRYGRRSDFSKGGSDAAKGRAYWVRQACTPLFRSKRASALADLLEIRANLKRHFDSKLSAAKLIGLTETCEGRRLLAKVVRKAKSDRVGVAMADISVCGAIQPYNALLVGKLAGMLAVSPAVVQEYKRRYSATVSLIASSMAGRAIIRDPKLVYFGTTSLYGKGSSQYNRIKIPADILGGDPSESIVYRELGRSESFGTSQFSDETVEALVECLRQSTNGQRVNSIFGEGVSPRLRKVREGLDILGMPTEALLKHGRRRSVYGVVVAKNASNYLLGIDKNPKYIFTTTGYQSVEAVVAWWMHRWLSHRITSDKVLDQVAHHKHIHPMQHGARVSFELYGQRDDDMT